MASTREELKHTITTKTNNKRQKRPSSTATRGLRSLAIAVALPLSLTLADISLLGSSHGYHAASPKPFWFPPLWALHLTSMIYTSLMGISAWLVWAQGGFHKDPIAAALYLAQLVLSLAWGPVALSTGAGRVGLAVCLATLGVLAACYRMFGKVNPVAGELVKPCLAWAGFLTLVNLKLVYL
ncbi:hypothetical protein LguiB_000146 [Lonicera macranthoides]